MNSIEELQKALRASPQTKEGSFKVSTWLLVISEIINLKNLINKLDSSQSEIKNAVNKIPTAEELTNKMKKEIESDLTKDDPNKVLF